MTEKRPVKKALYIALIAVLICVIGVLTVLLLRPQTLRPQTLSPQTLSPQAASLEDGGQIVTEKERDPNAAVGQYEGKTQEEIQAELDRIVEEGMFNISINATVIMEKGSDEAELRIENVAANHHLMSVEITLDDTGEVIYASGLIEPGYYIQSVPLDVVLEKGDYAATAVFTAYDTETEAVAGQAAARISIAVQN